MSIEVPEGSQLVEVSFEEGPLGVTLRRRNDGVVYVHEIVSESQAVNMDIELGDELWRVGPSTIGTTSLDKDAWSALIQFIKASPRPLTIVWRRQNKVKNDDSASLNRPQSSEPQTELSTSESVCVAPNNVSTSPKSPDRINNPPKQTDLPSLVPETPIPFDPAQVSPKQHPKSIELEPTRADLEAALENILSKLYTKEKEKQSLVSSIIGKKNSGKTILLEGKPVPVSPYNLPSYVGRVLVKIGDMTLTAGKSSTVSISQSDKIFVLLSDVLLICLSYPGDVLLVEDCINLQVCKVKTYILPPADLDDCLSPCVFDIIWPGGYIQTGFMSDEAKDDWMNTIYGCICMNVGYMNDILGWKHQYMLGTIHSAVVLRDEDLLKRIVNACEDQVLDFSIIDAVDDSGYTPLHYATIFRFTNIIQILHDATANADIADRNGLTSLHWSCLQLDNEALSILTTHTVDADIRDYDDRTPLFLVLVEGRDKSGKSNIPLMKTCSEILFSLHAEPNVTDNRGHSLLHYMAASWLTELIELLVQYKADVMLCDYENGMTALHFACRGLPLRKKISEAEMILSPTETKRRLIDEPEEIDIDEAVPTLRALLLSGCRPNFKDSNGKTPLHHLCDSADLVWDKSIGYAVITLLSFGARFDDSVRCQSLRSRLSDCNLDTIIESRSNAPVIDADALMISSFEAAREAIVPSSSPDNKDKPVPTCLLCGVNFTMFRRQHHCRFCNALCCDDCSKRRAILQTKEVRTCDSCYNRLQAAVEFKQQLRSPVVQITSPSNSLPANMKVNRAKLFGNKSSSTSSSPQRPLSSTETRQTGLQNTMATMNEAQQRLLERGEKLEQLNDKSAALANSANEFAKLAKQLKDKQKSGWF